MNKLDVRAWRDPLVANSHLGPSFRSPETVLQPLPVREILFATADMMFIGLEDFNVKPDSPPNLPPSEDGSRRDPYPFPGLSD
jgi:hypothetical protein